MTESFQKYVDIGLILLGLLLWLVLAQGLQFIWSWQAWPSYDTTLPVPLWSLIGLAGALLSALFVRRYQVSNSFLLEAANELSKVTWPDKKTTVYSTGVVMVAVLFAAFLLYGFDVFWSWVVSKILI